MAIVNAHLTILSLTSMKSDLQAQLTTISERRMFISMTESMIIAESQDSDVALEDNTYYLMLKAQDNMLDLQQKQAETKLNACEQNLESYQKLLDENVKEDFAPKLSV